MELPAIQAAIRAKVDSLRAAQDATLWRFFQGPAPDAFRTAFDDSGWPSTVLSTWSSGAGDV